TSRRQRQMCIRDSCEETRNNLAQLKNNPRVRVDEGKGELRRLGEEERQERIAKAEKAIQENCR
ncbi:DUF4124 domain-containing protein, partial [Pseudomonas aeruginosa]|nr:DUF4124 domain-containing protein [Pseudomonas aeruginosa]